MIARVIPALRTPRGVEWFDYAIPDGLDLAPGDLIRIPFRKGLSVGIVRSIEKTSAFENLKPVAERFADIRLKPETLALLDGLAARSFSSRPAVLHAWLGTLPKKPISVSGKQEAASAMLPAIQPSASCPGPRSPLPAPRETCFLPNHLFSPSGLIASVKQQPPDARILILTPWASRVPIIAHALAGASCMTSSQAMKPRFDAWSGFLRGDHRILVATRIGAWLVAEADAVFIDEPENDDHKQDELSPRYDARWLAEAAASFGVFVESFGLTPNVSLFSRSHFPKPYAPRPTPHALLPTRIPDLTPDLVTVDIHKRDWSIVSGLQGRALIELEDAQGKRPAYIIHPVHGVQARLRCADCGWTAICPVCGFGLTVKGVLLSCTRCHASIDMSLSCPSCGSTTLSKSRPGRDKLLKDLASQNISASVYSITEWNQFMKLEETALVILTDLSLLTGSSEDIRRRERLCIAFRRLADSCQTHNARLVVQADPKLAMECKDWLSGEKTAAMLAADLDERRQFHLPPAYRLLKMIFRGSKTFAMRQLELLKSRVANYPGIEVQGPFPVLYRPSSRSERYIGHLIAPSGTETREIRAIIEPLLKADTLFDLDPIAFFE